jgi:hypothetical protein
LAPWLATTAADLRPGFGIMRTEAAAGQLHYNSVMQNRLINFNAKNLILQRQFADLFAVDIEQRYCWHAISSFIGTWGVDLYTFPVSRACMNPLHRSNPHATHLTSCIQNLYLVCSGAF